MKRLLLSLMFACSLCGTAVAQRSDAHCTMEREDHYTCDAAAFRTRLANAHTIRVDTQRMDLYGKGQMAKLVAELGKQEVAPEQRPDLVFELKWVDRSGRLDIGPSDVALATLNVYDPARGAGKRGLIWAETFDSQDEQPWPAIVMQLVDQFKRDALKK